MRRKWRGPNDPTEQAKQVWEYLFPDESWPKGWKVRWVGFMRGVRGLCLLSEREILLSYGDARKGHVVETLVHEFVHVRCPGLRHGKEFSGLVNGLKTRIGL